MGLGMGHSIMLGPIPGPEIFSPTNHSSRLQTVRSAPNCRPKGCALRRPQKADMRVPLFPQEQTFRAGLRDVSD